MTHLSVPSQGDYIVRVTADKGMTLKRFRPKARGRVGPILKRSSHLTVVVAERG